MLTFDRLRTANVDRCEDAFHPIKEWSESDWATAMAGECGEACNIVKKRRRGNPGLLDELADELADLVIYADLLAARAGIDLGDAIQCKFNRTSFRVGSEVKL